MSTPFESKIESAVMDYLRDLEALRHMLEPTMYMAEQISIDLDKKHLETLEENATEKRTEGNSHFFKIPPKKQMKVRQLAKKSERYRTATLLLPRTFLVSFVSTYDAFLGNLIHALISLQPAILSNSAKQLTYKDLSQFSSMDDARHHMAESEVEGVLRKSHSEHFEWLENTFKVDLRKELPSWKTFIELTERRNLFVHNHGKASSQYFRVCKKHGVDTSQISPGDILPAGKDYLENSYRCLFEIGVKLSQVFYRKMHSSQLIDADNLINNIAFELLVDEKHELALTLLTFATDLKKFGSDDTRRVLVVNKALAHKMAGEQEKCLSTLSRLDWSACSDRFTLCIAVLKDDFPKAYAVMRRIGRNGDVDDASYQTWPVFAAIRKEDEFQAVYQEIFGDKSTIFQTTNDLDAPTPLVHDGEREDSDDSVADATSSGPLNGNEPNCPG